MLPVWIFSVSQLVDHSRSCEKTLWLQSITMSRIVSVDQLIHNANHFLKGLIDDSKKAYAALVKNHDYNHLDPPKLDRRKDVRSNLPIRKQFLENIFRIDWQSGIGLSASC